MTDRRHRPAGPHTPNSPEPAPARFDRGDADFAVLWWLSTATLLVAVLTFVVVERVVLESWWDSIPAAVDVAVALAVAGAAVVLVVGMVVGTTVDSVRAKRSAAAKLDPWISAFERGRLSSLLACRVEEGWITPATATMLADAAVHESISAAELADLNHLLVIGMKRPALTVELERRADVPRASARRRQS